ncbi:hypothetical protein NZD89_06090 [Alicyclobacillus fastidiosus]|uniref:Lipoprotein n=1 Tax=Alicyclobacillus fastidiosus TaxID=392011 RepID=A0ABY6ZJD6_9BACL|nr:hypothetical protein [Alicyclobacillus fastidiosus]WAH42984.1 hypothetical protein NZD89_06090 [Alicyclobacillus fastidiosus]GMA64952.1 hypothetical protein GCM10025859_53920 [Alicyclobacillus fastidiosus]
MKKLGLFLCSAMLFGVVSGCSTTPQIFDDKDVHFKLLNQQSMNGAETYTIQIMSTSPMELTHLSLYLDYPIKLQNGHESNPFQIKGRTNQSIVTLDKGQSTQFTFYAPIKQVFGDSTLLDFNHPDIELDGFSKEGSKEIPFEIAGDLSVFLSQHK